MTFREVNFDGLVGPTHNYAGLSLGNIASQTNAGATARPKAAALQGLAKMRHMVSLGIPQGILLPPSRPYIHFLRSMGFAGKEEAVAAAASRADPSLFRNAMSASSMWTANAATISPSPDCGDGLCHISTANLSTMLHRSVEVADTEAQLRLAFADQSHFKVHAALPANFGDEGAANFMRLCPQHGARGLEIFVFGETSSGRFPARQHRRASEAVARRHRLNPERVYMAQQSDAAIQAGAFHNDVVAVANETVLFTHEQAFDDKGALYDFILKAMPDASIIEVPASEVSLGDAIKSYLFNSQLVTTPDGSMRLILPSEVREYPAVWTWLTGLVSAGGPIRHLDIFDLRESMRNGGGPACLRLRVAVDEAALAAIDPRFLLNDAKCDRLQEVIDSLYPETVTPDSLDDPLLWHQCADARRGAIAALGFRAEELP